MALLAALGTLLKTGNGASPEVFTTVSQVGNITGPGVKADTIDVSNHNQANAYKQFIAGLKEGGDVKFVLFFDPSDVTQNQTGAQGLLLLLENRVVTNFQLALPTSPAVKWSFAGLVVDFANKYDVNGALMADVTIKVSGKPALA